MFAGGLRPSSSYMFTNLFLKFNSFDSIAAVLARSVYVCAIATEGGNRLASACKCVCACVRLCVRSVSSHLACTFQYLRGIAMRAERPRVMGPMCGWMYRSYVWLDHRPSFLMRPSSAPAILSRTAPPERRLWLPMRERS